MLTDPATGTPIDARSKSYYIPADVRAPLIGKWQSCSTPGCTRRAETSEIDHIIPFDHDVVVESHPPDNPINADHARQVDSCARSQDPTDLAGSVAAVETVETAETETAETDGSVLRFTSESSVEATGSEDQETRRSRRSRRVQESIWDVCWDPDEPPPF